MLNVCRIHTQYSALQIRTEAPYSTGAVRAVIGFGVGNCGDVFWHILYFPNGGIRAPLERTLTIDQEGCVVQDLAATAQLLEVGLLKSHITRWQARV